MTSCDGSDGGRQGGRHSIELSPAFLGSMGASFPARSGVEKLLLCFPLISCGRTDGWVGGWMDGWVGGMMDGWVDGWMDGWIDGWMDGRIDGIMETVCNDIVPVVVPKTSALNYSPPIQKSTYGYFFDSNGRTFLSQVLLLSLHLWPYVCLPFRASAVLMRSCPSGRNILHD